MFKIRYLLFLLLVFFYSCTRTIYLENTKVEKVTETVIDTVILFLIEKLYVEKTVNLSKDSTSKVSTKYAESIAKVVDGILYHTIKNKDTKIEQTIQYIQVEKEVKIKEPYPVVKYKISTWSYAIAALSLGLLILAWRIR